MKFGNFFKKKIEELVSDDKPGKLELPQIVQDLGLRINGLISRKISVTSFFLLNDKFLIKEEDFIDSYVIHKITVTDSSGGLAGNFKIVRAFTSNDTMFQFNCPDGKLNDTLMFINCEFPIIEKNETSSVINSVDNSSTLTKRVFAKVNEIEFDYEASFNLRSHVYTTERSSEKSDERLYAHTIEDMVEYLLIREFDATHKKNYIGVTINENDIETI
jgi:hypothetical protein